MLIPSLIYFFSKIAVLGVTAALVAAVIVTAVGL